LAFGQVGEKKIKAKIALFINTLAYLSDPLVIAQMPVLPVHLCISGHNMLKQIRVSSVKQPINK